MLYAWTDERVSTMKRLWVEGHSASQIANTLPGYVSRNAVIGKLHRMGLTGSRRTVNKQVKRKPKRARMARTQPPVKPANDPPMTPERLALRNLPPIDDAPTIDTVRDGQCKYIAGDPLQGGVCCGRATTPESPWCAQHRRLIYARTIPLAVELAA